MTELTTARPIVPARAYRPMNAPLTAEHLAEIHNRDRVSRGQYGASFEDHADDAEKDRVELLAEVDRLRAELAEQDDALGELGGELDERERLETLLDRFAAAVAPVEVIGEHSSGNDPWANALDMVTPAAEVDRLRQAVELLGSHLQGGSQALVDALTGNARLREELAEARETIAGLMNDRDELLRERGETAGA